MYLTAFATLVAVLSGPVFAEQGCLSDIDDTNYPKTIESDLYRSQREFAIEFLKLIQETTPEKNIFCSPYSTYNALMLAYMGAQGQTEQELTKALRLEWVQNKNHLLYAYQSEKRRRAEHNRMSSTVFKSANRMFVSLNVTMRECMAKLFHDEIESKDFPGNPEQSRNDINAWVANSTNQEIPEILTPGDVTPQTNLVLANAAYFKGLWDLKFNPNDTRKEIFHTSPEIRTLVDMMKTRGSFKTAFIESLQAAMLELPYQNGEGSEKNDEPEMSMIILISPFIQGLNDILANLTVESLERAMQETSMREIDVSLPKFEFKQEITLTPILKKMNIQHLFSSQVDLTRFSTESKLSIDEAKHIAKIKVDEEGSTAAAATVLFSFRSARPLDPTKFECNRPFGFLIFDHKLKAILFSGIYRDPMSQK